jgi:hypothetical protein
MKTIGQLCLLGFLSSVLSTTASSQQLTGPTYYSDQTGIAPFTWPYIDSSLMNSDGTYDDVLESGYNVGAGGGKLVQGESTVRFGIERNFLQGGTYFTEWNLDITAVNQSQPNRWMALAIDRNAATPSGNWNFWIPTNGKFNFCQGGNSTAAPCNQLAYFDSRGVLWSPNQIENTRVDFLAVLANSALTTNALWSFDKSLNAWRAWSTSGLNIPNVMAANVIATDAPAPVTTGVALGGTTADASNCGGPANGATGCLVINVAGAIRYVPYY